MEKKPRFTVKIARQVGYCYGVQRALDLTFKAAEETRPMPIYTLGSIIHNPQVVESLTKQSIHTASVLDEVERGTIIIRSHGVDPKIIDEAHERGLSVLDATCPFVKKAQQRAAELAKEGYFVVILGERDHPEVLSLLGYAGGDALVVEQPEDLEALPPKARRVGLIVQTTKSMEKLQEVVQLLLERVAELKVHNTICSATTRRQEEATKLTKDVDIMIVVGGKNSANTSRLAAICHEMGRPTYHIETAAEIDPGWFKDGDVVGVTTGTSTSQWILREVIDSLERQAAEGA